MAISNMTQLRDRVCTMFEGLENKTIEPKVAKEMNNAAGKIIGTTKVQLEYYAMRKEKPSIAFLK